MSNPRCAVCGQVNRVGAAYCIVCDATLDANGGGLQAPEFFYAEERRPGSLPTDIPSPHFQGAGDGIGATLEIYRKHFPLVGLLVVVTSLPLAVIQYASYSALAPGGDSINITPGGISFFGAGGEGPVLYWVKALLVNSLLAGALVYGVVEVQRTGAARARDCLVWGFKKLPKVLAVNVLCGLILYGGGLVALAMGALLLGPVGLLLAGLLLILPYIALTLTLSLAIPAAAAENRGVFESLRRSAELTRGYKGLIFLTYFLWWLITSVVSLVIMFSFFARVGGGGWSAAAVVTQVLVNEFLKSTTSVLTTFIFLGILKERRHRLEARAARAAG